MCFLDLFLSQNNEHASKSRDLRPVILDNFRYTSLLMCCLIPFYLLAFLFLMYSLCVCIAFPLHRKSRDANLSDLKANQAHDKTDLTKDVE